MILGELTKELVFMDWADAVTASRYLIATVYSKEYLFLEHKSGDYVYCNSQLYYYLFERDFNLQIIFIIF